MSLSVRTGSQHSAAGRSKAGGSILSKTAADSILKADRSTGKGFGMSNTLGGSKKQGEVVLTLDELQRIKESCSLQKNNDAAYRAHERKELQTLSNARVKNWPNTIEAVRKKREEDRIRKLEEEEIERRKIDAQEDALQNELRL